MWNWRRVRAESSLVDFRSQNGVPACSSVKVSRHRRASVCSNIECVVRSTARPVIVDLIRFQRFRCETGSKPADGSSSKTTCGSPTSATAQHSLRFMPPTVWAVCRVPATRRGG